jgi:hypothetical protein
MNAECPECGQNVYSDNYIYVGNHAAYNKGHSDSGLKIIGYRFYCRNEIEVDGELCECDTRFEVDL